ncbi:5'-methylthioadenosine/S-adenosylhomocysteine nucleosidase [Salipaludibacillus keqinensis]|uniref:adenosylhomocysteine nucleosidase n=1 Tax=Salipaludibacillus keqinensis TaxID=2045207 RepID=A0A323TG21_9BACI|nr:5'-methylthioadenosine/adenosylhomocysteine nucleosidase [Salipaludibacillus keqinensis]PYZ93778.1 5'-methylthioadenosine/S-adenosylhomocysteine nucleosidase [Salipaludibacillus keqinensis]
MTIGIIGAMDIELEYFQEAMTGFEKKKEGYHTFYVGSWKNEKVVMAKSGVGKVNAAMTAQKMIDLFQVENLIFTGVAGATNPELEVGDVVVSTSCQHHDLDASVLGFDRGTIPMYEGTSDFPGDSLLVELAYQAATTIQLNGMKVLKGKVVSGDQFIADKKHVEWLHKHFQADCVEMEGAAVAHVAHFHNVPFVIIRSISDKANGEATESFQTFMSKAAETSSKIVEQMIHKIYITRDK